MSQTISEVTRTPAKRALPWNQIAATIFGVVILVAAAFGAALTA